MRKLTFGLAVAMSILPSAGRAQVTLDMTQMTCANYLAMSPDQARVFSAWTSGWFNQRWGYITVGFLPETSLVSGNGAPATRRRQLWGL